MILKYSTLTHQSFCSYFEFQDLMVATVSSQMVNLMFMEMVYITEYWYIIIRIIVGRFSVCARYQKYRNKCMVTISPPLIFNAVHVAIAIVHPYCT